MYAIIQSGGRQYKVEEGATIKVERLDGARGSKVELTDVLLVQTDDQLHTGTPQVANAKVEATLVDQGRTRKIIVFKTKKRKHYRRKQGHRQAFTALRIDKISVGTET